MIERHPIALTVLVMAPNLGDDLSYAALDDRVTVIDGNAAFTADVRRRAGAGGLPEAINAEGQVDAWLSAADVLVIGHPVPRTIAARAPRLRWAHHPQAGVSNVYRSDLWTSEVLLTSGRGTVSTRAIAESAIAAVMLAARGFDEAGRQKREGRFRSADYQLRTVAGSTLGIVGLGGIGTEVGRLARALGMRVVATRWSIDAPLEDVDGADLVLPADRLLKVAAQSDFLVVASQLTEATRGMIGWSVFAAMKPHAVVVNIARGEEIDESALIRALDEGRIAGAILDVYDGELEGRPPRPELVHHPRVLLTPHIAGRGQPSAQMLSRALVRENLERFLSGRPLLNVVDRQRGY